MNETGLIVAEVVFLVLLYAFVWTVVRSSSRQLRAAQPQPPVAPGPPRESPDPPAPAPSAPVVAPAPAPVVATPVVNTTPSSPEPLAADDEEHVHAEARTQGAGPEEQDLDLASNLDPRLIVDSSDTLQVGHTIPLEGGITIGRSEGATLPIDDQFVSHMHARILRRGAYHYVEDLGSTNGTFLNDRRVDDDAQLKVHDALRIGQTTLRYEE